MYIYNCRPLLNKGLSKSAESPFLFFSAFRINALTYATEKGAGQHKLYDIKTCQRNQFNCFIKKRAVKKTKES